MQANHKLAALLAGHAVVEATGASGVLALVLDDGSALHVKTTTSDPGPLPSPAVSGVRQAGTSFSLDFTDGSSWPLELADPASSVMLRGPQHEFLYSD